MAMKNITFSADERKIELAREKAHKHKQNLNLLFREWLERYIASESAVRDYDKLMEKFDYVVSGKTFTRDEFNER